MNTMILFFSSNLVTWFGYTLLGSGEHDLRFLKPARANGFIGLFSLYMSRLLKSREIRNKYGIEERQLSRF